MPKSLTVIIKPCLSESARTVVSLGRTGCLSTQSVRYPGFPFASVMPYAADEKGRPIIFVSNMAMHTQNIQANPRVSLLITEENGPARVTLVGLVQQVSAADVSEMYLSRHENAEQWRNFTDFAYYRMELASAYFIGGFGVMGWITAENYDERR